jgi:phospholipase C
VRPRVRLWGALAVAAVVVAGLTAAAPAAQGHVPPALASRTTPIKHIVVIDLENQSFDELLGYWCQANPSRCPNGGMPARVTLSNGVAVTPSVAPDTIPNVLHTVPAQLAAMNIVDGVPQMNGWQNIPGGTCAASTGYRCITGYTPSQVPDITSLASQFAISDMTFSLADAPSWGGHLYAVMGSMDGFEGQNPTPKKGVPSYPGGGCNSDKITPWINPTTGQVSKVPSCVPDPSLSVPNGGAFEPTPVSNHATILDELQAAGLSWKIYGATKGSDGGYLWSVCPSIAQCLDTSQVKRLVEPDTFEGDATRGKLADFSLVLAGGSGNLTLKSCHNKFSMTDCDNYVGQLVSAIENSPDWTSTAVFLTWDDFGGFYDQVPPPATLNAEGNQAGPRLPMIIISPYARDGYTDTTPTTYAGVLSYVEHTFHLAALGPNDKNAYDLGHAFDYKQTPIRTFSPLVQRPLPKSALSIKPSAVGDDPS